jgi:hypothetical protein
MPTSHRVPCIHHSESNAQLVRERMAVKLRGWRRGSGSNCSRVAHPYHVVDRHGESEHPANAGDSSMASLARGRHGPESPEGFFYPLPPPPAKRATPVTTGAWIDAAGLFPSHIRRDLMVAQELFVVITFVGTQLEPPEARQLFHHRRRRLAFGVAVRCGQSGVNHQTLTVLREQASQVAEFRLLTAGLLIQPRQRIGRR